MTRERKKYKISHDEIFSTLQLCYQLDEYVHELQVFPDLRCVFGLKDILSE